MGTDAELGKIFIGGLAKETTTDGLRFYFEKYGEITDCVVMRDRVSGAPRGFGFVTYADPNVADLVVKERHVIDSKEVEAKTAVPRESEQLSGRASNEFNTRKVFVGGISHDTTEDEFRGYFAEYGTVSDCVIMYDPHTRKPRGFGFITFEDAASVERLVKQQHHELHGKRVEVKKAIPQDRIQPETQRHGGGNYNQGGYGGGGNNGYGGGNGGGNYGGGGYGGGYGGGNGGGKGGGGFGGGFGSGGGYPGGGGGDYGGASGFGGGDGFGGRGGGGGYGDMGGLGGYGGAAGYGYGGGRTGANGGFAGGMGGGYGGGNGAPGGYGGSSGGAFGVNGTYGSGSLSAYNSLLSGGANTLPGYGGMNSGGMGSMGNNGIGGLEGYAAGRSSTVPGEGYANTPSQQQMSPGSVAASGYGTSLRPTQGRTDSRYNPGLGSMDAANDPWLDPNKDGWMMPPNK